MAQLFMALDSQDPQDLTKFLDMMDRIHLDENPKWCVKSKLHITKIMFLCAVVHPCFIPCANSWWDGKLEIWPIGDWDLQKEDPRTNLKEH